MQRSGLERLWQTLLFEGGGLLMAVPLYQVCFGRPAEDSLALLTLLSLAVLIWSPLHNLAFDQIEHRLTGRTASDRPHALRLLHAVSHEVSPIVVTLPLILWVGQHSFPDALAANLGLTLFYMCYAYLFYLIYDRLRPLPCGKQCEAVSCV